MPYRDPLIHFLVIGALLFAALSLIGGGESGPSGERILIPADQVAELSRAAELLQGRPPTDDELAALVEEAIREEVYYRQALALGLDIDDDEVRRRLIEKMRYLTEDTVDPTPPTADLEAWFEANRASFRIPQQVTFDHLFFSPRVRGDSAVDDAEAAVEALRGGEEPVGFGDSTPLGGRFENADADRVRVLFGEPLTTAVFSAEPGRWIGPYESDFGWHVVRVTGHNPARDPAFAEVEAQVREAYAARRLAEANAAAFAELREDFEIAVQWEPDDEAEPWP